MTPADQLSEVYIPGMPHISAELDTCPTCDQPIPLERTAEIAGRLAARDRQRALEVAARLNDQFARDRNTERAATAQALDQAKRDAAEALETAKTAAAQKEASLREELRHEADSKTQLLLAQAARTSAETETTLRDQLAEAEQVKAQLVEASAESAVALENLRAEFTQNEATLREQLRQEAELKTQALLTQAARTRAEAETVLRGQLAEAEQGRQALVDANAASAEAFENLRVETVRKEAEIREQFRQEAELKTRSLLTDLEQARAQLLQASADSEAALEHLRADAAQSEARIRAETLETAEADAQRRFGRIQEEGRLALDELRTKHANARQADASALEGLRTQLAEFQQVADTALIESRSKLADAESRHRLLTEQMQAFREAHDTAIASAVQETRETLEKAGVAAVQAEQAKHFNETQKLIAKLDEVQKQLEKKTAQELGEGGELDLFEELKAAFENDLITRVGKGVAGADIIHEIRQDGQLCGKIIYERKNRKDWKNEYAVKLRADQIAADADHAILATNKFPAGGHQLHHLEGVIIACPARVLMLAELLRDQVVQMHQLRISNEERHEKTAKLYAFITGDHCGKLFSAFDADLVKLEDLDEAELKQHQTTWEKRGRAIKRMQKTQGDLQFEIKRIIGITGPSSECQ